MKRVYTSRGMHAQLLCDLLQSEGIPAQFGWDRGEGIVNYGKDVASVWILEDSDLERALRFVDEFSQPSLGEKQAATRQCPACGETLEEQFDTCWKCSAPDADPEDDISPAESEQAVSESNVGAQEQTDPLRVLVRLMGVLYLFLGFLGIRDLFFGDYSWLSILSPWLVAAGVSLLGLGSRWGCLDGLMLTILGGCGVAAASLLVGSIFFDMGFFSLPLTDFHAPFGRFCFHPFGRSHRREADNCPCHCPCLGTVGGGLTNAVPN